MSLYTRTVSFIGLNGQQKERKLHFIVQRADVLEHTELFQSAQDEAHAIHEIAKRDGTLTQDEALNMLKLLMRIIDLAYAEVDYDNDIINKSDQALTNFKSSLAYEALIVEITEDPVIVFDILDGIISTVEVDDEQKVEMDKLRKQYIERTTRQNDDNSGQGGPDLELVPDQTPDEFEEGGISAEEAHIRDLERQLAEAKRGK